MPTNASLKTGFSLAHGAGRKLGRNDANSRCKEDRAKNIDGDNDINNIVICENDDLFREEAPFAYKSIENVIDDLEHFGLLKKIASFVPVITYKCREQCC